jgi:uncharacterized protein (TIGR00255 family)
MPHSMTGFATAEALAAPFRLVWEIRAVNHRFLELGVRLPEELRSLEPACREAVAALLRRGKVDLSLKVLAAEGASPGASLAPDALLSLRRLEDEVRRVFQDARPLAVGEVLRWSGVLKEAEQHLDELGPPAMTCLEAALASFQESRAREGARIAEFLEQRNAAILVLLADVKPLIAGAQERYRDKLQERLQRLDVQADPARLEQELALVAQRADIAEELDRLTSHVAEVREVLVRDEAIGRRLDFLIQELNREANTFASKVQDEALTRAAVDLKVLIEQMREQVQNLE